MLTGICSNRYWLLLRKTNIYTNKQSILIRASSYNDNLFLIHDNDGDDNNNQYYSDEKAN